MENFTFFPDMVDIDANQFALQWDVLIEVLVLIIVVSFVVERVLAVVFESNAWVAFHDKRETGSGKPIIAYFFSLAVCVFFQIDIMAVLMSHAHVSIFGEAITAGVIAGGSKASIALFRNLLNVQSEAMKSSREIKAVKREAAKKAAVPAPNS